MEKSVKNYLVKLGALSTILLVLTLILFLSVLNPWFSYVFPIVILYFFLFSVIQHLKLVKCLTNNPRVFNTNYMAWFGIKLFLNLSFVIVYVLLNRSQALSFVAFFGFCYVVYTAFEVISLSKILRSGNVK